MISLLQVVLGQVPASPPVPSPWAAWATPSAIMGAVGSLVAIVGWLIRQDRRIEAQREAHEKLQGSMERYQTRETCGEHHRDLPSKGSMADAFEQIRALERAAADDRRNMEVALANINGVLQRLEEKLDALADSPRTLGRQRTNPGFDPKAR